MRLRQVLLTIGLASTLVVACGDDDNGGSGSGDAGEAGDTGKAGSGGRGGTGGTRNMGGDPNLGGLGGDVGGGGVGVGGTPAEDCTEFVDFVHQLVETTADDSLPEAIPDLCPTGADADLEAPASAFDDLF